MTHTDTQLGSAVPRGHVAVAGRGNVSRAGALLLGLLGGLPGHAAEASNPAQDRMLAMSEVDRSAALLRIVESSGQFCRTVARTFFQGEDAKGNAFWNIECEEGRAYAVLIKNDEKGSTRVLSCQRLTAIGGGECFRKLD